MAAAVTPPNHHPSPTYHAQYVTTFRSSLYYIGPFTRMCAHYVSHPFFSLRSVRHQPMSIRSGRPECVCGHGSLMYGPKRNANRKNLCRCAADKIDTQHVCVLCVYVCVCALAFVFSSQPFHAGGLDWRKLNEWSGRNLQLCTSCIVS